MAIVGSSMDKSSGMAGKTPVVTGVTVADESIVKTRTFSSASITNSFGVPEPWPTDPFGVPIVSKVTMLSAMDEFKILSVGFSGESKVACVGVIDSLQVESLGVMVVFLSVVPSLVFTGESKRKSKASTELSAGESLGQSWNTAK